VPGAPVPSPELTPFERVVLNRVRSLAGVAGAPLEALTEACSEDVKGVWNPFDRAVRAATRGRLTQDRLAKGPQTVLYVGAAALAVLIVAVQLHPPFYWHTMISESLLAFAIPAAWARTIAAQDRLTPSGEALARDAATLRAAVGPVPGQPGEPGLSPPGPTLSDPTSLRRLAVMMGLDIPVPVPGCRPGVVSGVRPGGNRSAPISSGRTPRPRAAWSSFGGQWRQVRIAAPKIPRLKGPLIMLLPGLTLIWAILVHDAPSGVVLKFPIVIVPAAMAAIGLLGLAGVIRWLVYPAQTHFDGQVIAKWTEETTGSSGDTYVYVHQWIALDNGTRGWPFEVSRALTNSLELGDLVRASVSRSGHLRRVVITQHASDAGLPAPGQAPPSVLRPPAVG
jgi:hypothetical protein